MNGEEMPARLGRYEIVRELGKGAMGVVYEGRDPALNRRVAIKTARKDVMESTGMAEEMMERFLREAHSAGALDHPNIITLYDAGQEGDIAFIAMEYLEGGDLRDVLDGKRHLSTEEIAEIGATICDALQSAHERGIVHRDIKPANIMTPTDRPLKLADFGIAHVVDSELTQDGALVGTPHYMSPEQFMGQKLDGRSDLFSVGVMLYELLTGRKPYAGEALTTVMHQVLKTTPTEPAKINHRVSDALSQVVMKAMSKKPQERYATGREMAAALRESLRPYPDAVVLGFATAEQAPAPREELPGIDTLMDGLDVAANEAIDAPTLLPGTTLPPESKPPSDMEQTIDLPRGVPAVAEAVPGGRLKRGVLALVIGIFLLLLLAGWTIGYRQAPPTGGAVAVEVPVAAYITGDDAVLAGFDALLSVTEKADYLDQAVAAGKAEPLQGVTVTAIHGESGAVLDTQTLDASGESAEMLRIPGEVRDVKFVLSGSFGTREVREERLSLSPQEWEKRQVFLLHE